MKKQKDLLQIIKDEKITINYDNEGNVIIGSVYPLSQELHDRIKGFFLKDDGYMGIEL